MLNETRAVYLKDVKKGNVFRRKPDAATTWIKGDYDRSSKRYDVQDWDDINRTMQIKGLELVYIGFTF